MVKIQSVNLDINTNLLFLQVTILRENKETAIYCANISNLLSYREEDLELKKFIEKMKSLLKDLEKEA